MKSKKRGTFLDNAISYLSPRAGFERMQARNALEVLRKYDANSVGRRTDGWTSAKNTSANSEIGPAIHRVRERVRDLVRNNPYAGRAVSVIESNMVGTGIMASIEGRNQGQKDRIRGLWNDWADSTDCDADGLHNLYGLQALAARTVAESGEAIIVRKWRRKSDGFNLVVPYQIQVLEGDFIDTTKEYELENGSYIRQGVEYDKFNRRVAYWLWNQHPGENFLLNIRQGLLSQRVDARDVRHLFRVERPGQIRGISWGASCVVRLSDLDAYEDAQLVRQRIAACFAAFVRDIEMPADPTAAKNTMSDKIEAGAIEILPSGKTVEFPNIPTVQNDGHSERVLRSIAMGWGVTYESLTGDLSNVNFSSGKMGWIEFQRNLSKWQQHMFIPRFCSPVFSWFLEAADIGRGVDIGDVRAKWTTPRREMIDPTKEIPAIIAGVRGGIQTLPEAIREQGNDLEDHMAEIKSSNDILDRLGIILDSDPRKVQKAGGLQQPPGSSGQVTD